jgi:Ca-activated chloride channel family protein
MRSGTTCRVATAALVVGAAWAACAGIESAYARQGEPQFKSSSDLVLVPTTVTDRAGHFVRGLRAADFELFEDGIRRPIVQFTAVRVPVSVAIVLDVSGSMSTVPERWELTLGSLASFLSRLESDDEVALIAFNQQPQRLGGWTRHTFDVFGALRGARTGGPTALLRALSAALPVFTSAVHTRKALLLISDGNDNDIEELKKSGLMGIDARKARAVEEIRRSGVALYAIAMGMGQEPVNRWMLGDLAEPTGGYVEVVRGADALESAVARVADDLRAQYMLGFEPTKVDGAHHEIAVKTRGNDHRLRARSGYFAAGTAPTLPR